VRPQPIAESDDSQGPGIQQNGQTKLHVLYVWGAGQYITFLRVPVVIPRDSILVFLLRSLEFRNGQAVKYSAGDSDKGHLIVMG
jgi:hypothetical protein